MGNGRATSSGDNSTADHRLVGGRHVPHTSLRTVVATFLAASLLCAAGGPVARAQEAPPEDDAAQPKGFSLRKDDSNLTNALEDFDRYAEKREWEKAFRAVSTIADAEPKGMVLWKDGLMIPTRQRLFRSLLTLPPEGRQAFRLFFNPKAKQAFEAFRSREAEQGAIDPAPLRKVVESYFLTDAGDQAADHLADLYFQTGEFSAAASLWGQILEGYPDSDLPTLRIEVKRAIALARAGQWQEFDAAVARVREKHAGQTVKLGGRDVVAAEHLASLGSRRDAQPSPTDPGSSSSALAAAAPAPPIKLPTADAPAWQITFDAGEMRDQVRQMMAQGWWVEHDVSNVVPVSAADGKRIYVNWIGVCFAVDARTGKLLWRTDKFSDLTGKVREIIQGSGVALDRYAITPLGDRVLYSRLPLDRLNHYQEPYRLVCAAADTGKVHWSSEKGALANWNFIGQPMLQSDGDTLVSSATPKAGGELNLVALSLNSGNLLWTIPLGNPQAGTNRRGQPQYPIPVLVPHEGLVYVMTNNGAVICVRPDARRVEWAFTYEPPRSFGGSDMVFWGGQQASESAVETPGVVILKEGILYIKECRGTAVYALDLANRSLKWKRPCEMADMLAGVGDKHLYLVGNEVSGIDRETRAMKWSTKIPVQTGDLRPVVAGENVYVLTSRGVFEIDGADGDVTRILRPADEGVTGGVLWLAGERLVTVSSSAVTAYPLPKDQVAGER